jgi:hypothetical protein
MKTRRGGARARRSSNGAASSSQDEDESEGDQPVHQPRAQIGFGTSTREAVFKMNNELGSSRWESDTANVPFFNTSHNWGRAVIGGSLDKAEREEILKHDNVLGASTPHSPTAEVAYPSRDDLNAAAAASRSAVFGKSDRGDLILQYNVMRVPVPRTDAADAKFVDNPLSPADSRYRSPPSFDIGKGSTREDHAKLVNSLGVAMPRDMSETSPTELLEHPSSDSRFRRVRGAEDWSKQKTARDDIHKQANVLGASTYASVNPDADWPEDVDRVFKTGLGGAIPKAKPAELLKHYNSLKVHVPHDGTANVDYPDKPISKFDSRYPAQPSFTMGASKREDVFKLYNTLGASIPVGRTDTVKYVENAISTFDSRFRRPTSPRFGADKAERDDVLKMHNSLGVALPSSLTANATHAKVSAMEHLSTSKHIPSAHMGSSKREDIYKMANPLGAALPIDRTPNADFTSANSKIDSRFPSATSATFGVSDRQDAMKLYNSLKVPLPSKEAGQTPYLHPDDFQDSITRNHARRGKGKWVNHEMGIASRGQHWKEANVMGVPTPFAANTAGVDYPQQVGYGLSSYDPSTGKQRRVMDSRIRHAPGVSFGTTTREDVLLHRDAMVAGAHPPHSKRVQRELERLLQEESQGPERRPSVPRTKTVPSQLHFKVRPC